jgi:hypothetical protein
MIVDFFNSDAYRVIPKREFDTQGNTYMSIDVTLLREIPCEIRLTAADAINNLRSVVDNALWLISRRHGASENIFFPVAKTQSGFPLSPNYSNRGGTEIKRDLLKLPNEVRTIIENVQPFKTTDKWCPNQSPLALLHDLWNHDKHRLLMVAVFGTWVKFIALKPDITYGFEYFGSSSAVTPQTIGQTVTYSLGGTNNLYLESDFDLKATVNIVFDEFRTSSVITVLTDMYRFISQDIIEQLKPYF